MFIWKLLPYCLWLFTQLEAGTIKVRITDVRNTKGEVMVALFNTQDGFPYEISRAVSREKSASRDGKAEVTFKNVAPGKYALALFHDTNGDGKLNTNFMGIPKEGYGVSNNSYNTFSAPGFEQASFIHQSNLELIIKMKY